MNDAEVSAVPARRRILIVEDEVLIAMDLQRRLEDRAYDVPAIAASAEMALETPTPSSRRGTAVSNRLIPFGQPTALVLGDRIAPVEIIRRAFAIRTTSFVRNSANDPRGYPEAGREQL